MEKTRDYGVDLLRPILMIFIIVGHIYAHTDIRNELPFLSGKWIFTWYTQAITVCAVNCFVLISGYYMSKTKYDIYRLMKLWSKVIFYSIGISAILFLCGKISFSYGKLLSVFFPVFRCEYWFFTIYIFLFLLIPFINSMIASMSRKKHAILVAVLVLFLFIEPVFSAVFYEYDMSEGFSIVGFVAIYLIGAFLARCKDVSPRCCILVLLGSSGVMLLSKIVLVKIVEQRGLEFGTGLMYHNNNVLVLLNAVALFELFKQINLRPAIRRIVVWINPSVLSVYLIHENPSIRELLWNKELTAYLCDSSFALYCISLVLIGVVVFTICILVDKIISWLIFRSVDNCKTMRKLRDRVNRYNALLNE